MSTFNELYIIREPLDNLFNSLTTQEKQFAYLMFRSSLPMNHIYRDQNHEYSNEIINLFETIYANKDKVNEINSELFEDIKLYLVYLWTNHGPYFMKEHSNNKRTPKKLGMIHLTQNNLTCLLEKLDCANKYDHLLQMIFDDVDPEMSVDGSIEQSGNNYYSKGFTKEHYNSFSQEIKNRINAYFSLDENAKPQVNYYSIGDKYNNELNVTVYWLKQALKHVSKYPDQFDEHIINSLGLLIEYFETGDEELFKQHSIEWLKTKSKLDYTLGFIETYHDPMTIRGQAGGEITIKTVNMEKLNPILFDIEQRLPNPPEYKKEQDSNTITNVSMNKILYSSGDYGPQIITAAYCLPNYDDIRSKIGAKQILYKLPSSTESTLNPELAKQFRTKSRQEFINMYDPNDEIFEDLWDVQVLLHESIGHGSGKLHKHTFKEGENLMINGVTYNIGDTIDVTDSNYSEFIKEDSSSLEELRAEINALYMSIQETDILAQEGLFKNWSNILDIEELRKQCVIEMCRHIFRRLLSQGDDMTEIKGAHARANTVITNFLLEGGGIEIEDEIIVIDGESFHILDIKVVNLDKVFNNVLGLLQGVQRIKSTGDTNGCKKLFEKYTSYPISIEQAKIYKNYMLANKKKLVGNIKGTSRLFPNYVPVILDDILVDVTIGNTMDIFEQNMHYKDLMLSTNY